MSNDTLRYLQEKDWDYKTIDVSNQYCVVACPFCFDEKSHFYISFDGLWDCKKCGESGNLYQLKARLGDLSDITSIQDVLKKKYKPLNIKLVNKYHKALSKNKEAVKYLKSRGFTAETIKFFKLGLSEDKWIAIPHIQDKTLWNFKFRNYLVKGFKRVPNQPTVLFNIDNVDVKKSTIAVVESETDTMAAHQMGVTNVVGITGGAETFKPEWVSFFNQFKTVYVCLNSDAVGQKGAYKVAEKIGLFKCRNVILPTNDVNDFLKEKSGEEFKKLFSKEHSEKFRAKDIGSIDSYVDQLDDWFDDEGTNGGLQINFEKLNDILHGFKEEDLIILSGDTGKGKTTLVLNFLQHFLSRYKKCLGFFLEGKIIYYILRMMSIESGIEYQNLRDDPKIWKKLKDEFAEYPMFFYSGAQSDMDSRKMREILETAVKLYDIDFVFIDNLQKYVRPGRDLVQETSKAVSELKDLAVDLKIPILLITHIRKPSSENSKVVTMHDAKSSSTIYQDADIYITIWDDKSGYKLSVQKNRMGEGGIVLDYDFHKNIGRFEEVDRLDIKEEKDEGL